MMCDECGVRPANIHLTTFVNGEKQERNLCATCMTKYKKQIPSLDIANLAGILSGFIGKALTQKNEEPDASFEATCSGCGIKYSSFKKNGMLGCSECYKAFREPIEEMLIRMHGNAQHNGRIPGGVDSNVSLKLKIDRMKQKLVTAIADEEYEMAATLRDEIRSLTKQLENASRKEEGADE